MHSHGNINAILDDVVGTGVDMLNPLDSTDGMDLVDIRQRYPRLTLVGGGIDKFLYDRPLSEIEAGLRRSIDLAGRRGRFLLMDPGGIPENIDVARYRAIRRTSRQVRGQPGDMD
jgi:uroporphyrinogen decarboxylase